MDTLPVDMLRTIFEAFDLPDQFALAQVCKIFNYLAIPIICNSICNRITGQFSIHNSLRNYNIFAKLDMKLDMESDSSTYYMMIKVYARPSYLHYKLVHIYAENGETLTQIPTSDSTRNSEDGDVIDICLDLFDQSITLEDYYGRGCWWKGLKEHLIELELTYSRFYAYHALDRIVLHILKRFGPYADIYGRNALEDLDGNIHPGESIKNAITRAVWDWFNFECDDGLMLDWQESGKDPLYIPYDFI